MPAYRELSRDQLTAELSALSETYKVYQAQNLKLDMSRGKPGAEQLDLSMEMLSLLPDPADCKAENGFDCRNYGLMEGIPEARAFFAQLLGVEADNVIVGGNSSLNLMYDVISGVMTHGLRGHTPWMKQEGVKFLCPVPGYDRHFSVTGHFGIEMITVPMTPDGPDMDEVERLVANDSAIKGIWCIPKYSNPEGITYSDETVRRFGALTPAAPDFVIMWDNAYCVHDIEAEPDILLNIMDECKKNGNENLPMLFTSTSKITFPGAGVSAVAASPENIENLKKRIFFQTIGYDKLNQLRHMRYVGDMDALRALMKKHAAMLRPKFETVLRTLDDSLGGLEILSWKKPHGGYFVSVDTLPGCAARVIALCKEAGVVMTPAGATFPYGRDPQNRNIRIAPTFPPVSELSVAMELFCLCVKIASLESLLG